MTLPIDLTTRELNKFIDAGSNDTAVRSALSGQDESGDYKDISTTTNSQVIQSINTTPIEKVDPPFISLFRQVDVPTGYTTLAVSNTKDDTTVTVADGTKITVGHILTLYTETGSAFYTGFVLSVATNDVTLDTPVNASFPIGASVSSGAINMNLNGSVTPQIFKVRQPDLPVLASGVEIVIHRIIFQCYTDTAVNDFSQFGDIAALTNGLFLRFENGAASNIFNIKSNGDFSNIAYDFATFDTTRQNVNGFTCRLTFGGNSKMGTSILLKDGDSLEMWVQDDLTGLTRLRCMAEGYLRPVLR
jgi:hypothetical protein